MTEPRSRGRTVVRAIKHLFFILSLLSLLYIGKLLIFNNPVDMLKEGIQGLLEDAVRMKIEEKNGIETISKLLDEARLIKNEEQLEIFKQNLKKAVNEAYEEETEDKYRLAAAVEHFNDKIDEVNPSLQVLKQASKTNPSAKQIVNIAEHLMSKTRTFFVLRMKAFAEGATDTEKNINDILNVFDPQQDLHAEL